ncbi:MAG: hypothetical protein AAFX04_01560 [Pseudomonadota bacterium]
MKKSWYSYSLLASSLMVLNCSGPSDPVTAAVAIGGAQDLVSNSIENASDQYDQSVQRTALEISNQIDTLRQILGEDINKPISELDASLQRQIFAILGSAESLQTLVSELPRCVGGEGEVALANLNAGIQNTLDAIPLADTKPTIYYVADPAVRVPFTINSERFAGEEYALVAKGSSLPTSEDYCDITANLIPTATQNDEESWRRLKIGNGSDPAEISVIVPTGIRAGQYIVSITAREKWLGMCLGSRVEVGSTITVADPVLFTPKVSVIPICEVREIVEQPFNGSCTNGSTRDNKTCSRTYTFNEPNIVFDRYTFEDGGRGGGASASRSGNGVAVSAEAEKRNFGEGGTNRVTWRGKLIGHIKKGSRPSDPISIDAPNGLAPGESISFSFDSSVPESCKMTGWRGYMEDTVAKVSTPTVPADPTGQIHSRAAGVSLNVDTTTGRATVTRSASGCL